MMDHPNVISLKDRFFSTTGADELFLNLVMEYVPDSMHRVSKFYSNTNQSMPLIFVKLYMHQVSLRFSSDWEGSVFMFSHSDTGLWFTYRFSGVWLISTLSLEFATEIWSLKIYWFVYIFSRMQYWLSFWKNKELFPDLISFCVLSRLILLHTRLRYVILEVQKCWYVDFILSPSTFVCCMIIIIIICNKYA